MYWPRKYVPLQSSKKFYVSIFSKIFFKLQKHESIFEPSSFSKEGIERVIQYGGLTNFMSFLIVKLQLPSFTIKVVILENQNKRLFRDKTLPRPRTKKIQLKIKFWDYIFVTFKKILFKILLFLYFRAFLSVKIHLIISCYWHNSLILIS